MTQQASSSLTRLSIETAAYLAIARPQRINDGLDLTLTDHSFLPRPDDLASDWVASVAAPAFKLLRQQRGPQAAFCSIGTGSGLDALVGIEILSASCVGITDVHEDVVRTAAENIARNHRSECPVAIEAGYGDLLTPLRDFHPRYDVIYENLPNIPLQQGAHLDEKRTSSSHVSPRSETLPQFVSKQLLELHYLALRQSRDFLRPGGVVLSMLGGRVPLKVFHRMARHAGFSPVVLSYTWKVQTDPEAMIRRHAEQQQAGFGPFFFYPAKVLEKTFASIDPATTGSRAGEIEAALLPRRLDAVAAYAAFKEGVRIGHTVVVLQSQPA